MPFRTRTWWWPGLGLAALAAALVLDGPGAGVHIGVGLLGAAAALAAARLHVGAVRAVALLIGGAVVASTASRVAWTGPGEASGAGVVGASAALLPEALAVAALGVLARAREGRREREGHARPASEPGEVPVLVDRWASDRGSVGVRSPHLDLHRALEAALERDELDVHYQPVFSLPTGRVTGFEALARWDHPGRGPVPPSEFIPIAEDTGLIVPLGHQVLARALAQLRAWDGLEPGGEPLHVAVNLSPRQLLDARIGDDVSELLRRASVDPSHLVLEITERAVLDHEAAATVLDRLHALGVRLAIDDYGSGNASIGYLRALPADVLKIDQSLVRSLQGDDGTSRALIRAITELAEALDMTTVAEGVETVAQLRSVVALGCRSGQGFLLGRPAPAAAATAALCRLADRAARSVSGPWLDPWWEPTVERPVA